MPQRAIVGHVVPYWGADRGAARDASGEIYPNGERLFVNSTVYHCGGGRSPTPGDTGTAPTVSTFYPNAHIAR